MAHFHNYSLGNVLLIARQKPDATRVAGIRTWNQLGRFVKKGENGIAILAPVIGKARKKQSETEGAKRQNVTDEVALLGFRRVFVWDQSATKGAPLPEFSKTTGEVGEYLERLVEFVADQGIAMEYDEKIAPALGMSYGGKIALLPGQTKPEEFSALVHEASHELLHRGERRTATTKTIRETEAEAVAFVVAKAIGLDAASSADYIQLYHGNAELLMESLEMVQQTATVILAAIAPKSEPTQEPEPSSSEPDSSPFSPPPMAESATAESVPCLIFKSK
jgi:pimeloyl-ACP methyl ester carboxylesterase